MKDVNCYYEGFVESDKRIDFLKYGLLNDFGPNLEKNKNNIYNEDKIAPSKINRVIQLTDEIFLNLFLVIFFILFNSC